jgi:thiol:disulfide interchange protein DsbD
MKPQRDASGRSRLAAIWPWVVVAALCPFAVWGQIKLLEPERAFVFSVQAIDETTVEARFAIASGYYLYREKLNSPSSR